MTVGEVGNSHESIIGLIHQLSHLHCLEKQQKGASSGVMKFGIEQREGKTWPGGEQRLGRGVWGWDRGLGEQRTSLSSRLRRVEVKKHQPGERVGRAVEHGDFTKVGGQGVQAGGHRASLAGLGKSKGSCSTERGPGRMEPGGKLRNVPGRGKC